MPLTNVFDINSSPSDGSNPDCGSFVDTDQILGSSQTSRFSAISASSPKSFTVVHDEHPPVPAKEPPVPPIALLPGEKVQSLVDPVDTVLHGRVYLTNYRIMIMLNDQTGIAVIPNLAVEAVEISRDAVLTVICRNGRIFRISTNIKSGNTFNDGTIGKQLYQTACESRSHRNIFAFQVPQTESTPLWLRGDSTLGLSLELLRKEFARLAFPDYWHISNANVNFGISDTYPEHLILPKGVDEGSLVSAAAGRFRSRIPTAVWRDVKSGAILLRSSQPVVSWFPGMTYHDEVNLFDMCRRATGDNAEILVMDARSMAAAMGNRLKSGGYESPTVYQKSTVKFMNLPNIHSVRDSFAQFRQSIATREQDMFFYQNIHQSSWLYQVHNIILSAKECIETLVDQGKTVLVHCSDGWDRTTQIVALAKLMGDGYYRSIEGFEVLVRSDWIGFGHKFSDRNSVFNNCHDQEKSPIFLQWLDCVYQLCAFNPTAFEFNTNYLVKVAQHSYSGLFGTFLFNSIKEYKDCLQEAGYESLPSLWAFLKHYKDRYQNVFYESNHGRLKIPPVRNLRAWEAVYVPNRFEEPLNCMNDGVAPNFSDLAHSSYIESFYADSSSRQIINRSHSEENVSSNKSPSTSAVAGTSSSSLGFPIEPTCSGGKLKKSASQSDVSQADAVSLTSSDLKFDTEPQSILSPVDQCGSASIPSTSFCANSSATASEGGSDQSAITSASEGDQSDPEPSSSGTSSRNSVIHRSRKFRLRFGKEKVIDADGLTSIINIEVDSLNRLNSKNEKAISDLQAQIKELQRRLEEKDGGNPPKENPREEVVTTTSEDEYFFVDNPSLNGSALHDDSTPVTLDAEDLKNDSKQLELDCLSEQQRARQREARLSTRSSDRNSEAFSEHAFQFDEFNVQDDSNSSYEHQRLVPSIQSVSSTQRRGQRTSSSNSFTTIFSTSAGSNQGQTVQG